MKRIRRSQPQETVVTRRVTTTFAVETPGAGFTELTAAVADFLEEIKAGDGEVTLFCRHTSASLTIQENADPDVRTDLLTALEHLAPQDFGWVHHLEGPDDMPAHVKTMLTGVSLAIPAGGWRSAPGRVSILSNTGQSRICAKWLWPSPGMEARSCRPVPCAVGLAQP